jgi:hypothetical protein
MGNVPANTDCDTMDELVEKTRGPRAQIIDAILFHRGRANAKQIRNYGRVPSGMYHFNVLEEQGIIRRSGTDYVSEGGSAIAFHLTDFGVEVSEELDTDAPDGHDWEELRDVINEIANRVEKNTDRLDTLESKTTALSEYVGELDARVTDYEGRNPNDE